MVKFTNPVEMGNEAEKDGTSGKAIAPLIETVDAQPSYFALENGRRMAAIIFEENDQARMPVISEPLYCSSECIC
ncbi:hypothetical protein [Hoeflea prorocentri]|uniref:Uncharacterized protein n=1 Tax=Hoeflea prorocentri TaxID=1922333 RepID=A0A9X3UHV8_9HYPH|nr:hypothetical protein [Hoeflea prorocentri]MCY6380735.1 hypothetical protein [Hoeflea prorocentri]MDA5398535.1 hypothetical protein [Hoeflea prorocentri]